MRLPFRFPESLQVLLNQVVLARERGLTVYQKAVPVNGGFSLPVVVELADFQKNRPRREGFQ